MPAVAAQGLAPVLRDANELEGERVQQQEQETEMEQEQERVEVAPLKQPYQLDDPKPLVWPLEQLGAAWAGTAAEQTPGAALTQPPKTPFYSLSSLCVKGGGAAGGNAHLLFPDYLPTPTKWSTTKAALSQCDHRARVGARRGAAARG
jgi:hypothetical protein